jgi:iron(III) transport system substrate-binding protein
VAAGECGVAVSNTYYLARLMRSDKPEDQPHDGAKSASVWPNQATFGTHINVSGGGMLKHRAEQGGSASSSSNIWPRDEAQRYFADGNNEWPAVASVKVKNPALEAMGKFKADTLPVGDAGEKRCRRGPAHLRPRRLEISKLDEHRAGGPRAPYRQRRLF